MLHDLTMSSIVLPESVSGLTISSRTESSLSLDWTYQSDRSSPRTGVEVEVRKSGVLVRNTTEEAADLGAITISSLLPLTSYSITIYVVSDVGRSQPSTTINTNTLSLSELMDACYHDLYIHAYPHVYVRITNPKDNHFHSSVLLRALPNMAGMNSAELDITCCTCVLL